MFKNIYQNSTSSLVDVEDIKMEFTEENANTSLFVPSLCVFSKFNFHCVPLVFRGGVVWNFFPKT